MAEQASMKPVRQTRPMRFADKRRHLVGVDIGGTKIETVLLGPDGSLLKSCRTAARQGNEAVLSDIMTSVRHVTRTLGKYDAFSVGIGIPGQVQPSTGMVRSAVNLGIDRLPLGPVLSHRLDGVVVHVENDVNAAALGAATLLPTECESTSVLINFGTGLAAGVVSDGRIEHGDTGICGEIGHIAVEPHMFPCSCGQHGCLETVASGSAVQRLWPDTDGPAMPKLIAQAEHGNHKAQAVLDMVIDAQATAVTIVALCIDPGRILLGGGLLRTGEPMIRRLKTALGRRADGCAFLTAADLSGRITPVPTDQPIGAVGAALSARED